MKNRCFLFLSLIFIICASFSALAQSNTRDNVLKDSLYNENRGKVLNYSMKEFDALFFEFF
jgi:hypothetical protein